MVRSSISIKIEVVQQLVRSADPTCDGRTDIHNKGAGPSCINQYWYGALFNCASRNWDIVVVVSCICGSINLDIFFIDQICDDITC